MYRGGVLCQSQINQNSVICPHTHRLTQKRQKEKLTTERDEISHVSRATESHYCLPLVFYTSLVPLSLSPLTFQDISRAKLV